MEKLSVRMIRTTTPAMETTKPDVMRVLRGRRRAGRSEDRDDAGRPKVAA
ncbi:hypothetical protein [Streptomyces sp. NPDC094149]